MLVNLSDALTLQGKTEQLEVQTESDSFDGVYGSFDITEKSPVSLTAWNTGDGKAEVEGNVRLTFATQCDRCLADVLTVLDIKFDRTVTSPDAETEDEDSRQFMDGYQLDVDALVQNEILVNWPVKILCKEDCRGICPKCGQNLNMGECGCDTFVPDPRMAVLKDIFESNKEV